MSGRLHNKELKAPEQLKYDEKIFIREYTKYEGRRVPKHTLHEYWVPPAVFSYASIFIFKYSSQSHKIVTKIVESTSSRR